MRKNLGQELCDFLLTLKISDFNKIIYQEEQQQQITGDVKIFMMILRVHGWDISMEKFS